MRENIQKVYLYNGRTNEILREFCSEGIHFDGFKAIETFASVICVVDASFIKASSYTGGEFGDYDRRERIFYLNNSVGKENYQDRSFWTYREKIQGILREIDAERCIGFPEYRNPRVAYAEESYSLAKESLGIDDKVSLTTVFEAYLGGDKFGISKDQLAYLVSMVLDESTLHLCPVCKTHYFTEELETCPTCGWINDRKDEKGIYANRPSEHNPVPMRVRDVVYYLLNNEKSRKDTQKAYQDYQEVFDSLIKVKKALAEKVDDADLLSVIYEGVDIDSYEFSCIRETLTENLAKIYVKNVLSIPEESDAFEIEKKRITHLIRFEERDDTIPRHGKSFWG